MARGVVALELTEEQLEFMSRAQKTRWRDSTVDQRYAGGRKSAATKRRHKAMRDDPNWVRDVAEIAAMLKLKCPRGGQA